MNSDFNTSENEEKSQVFPRQPMITQLAKLPTLSSEARRNLLGLSDAIQCYVKQNQQVLEQFAKTASVYESMNLRVIPEVLKIIETQRRLVDFNKILFSPAFELATAVNQSIERLLVTDTARINEILKQSAFQSQIWREQQQALVSITESLHQYCVVWHSHFVDISKFAILSQTALSRISWEQIGNALDILDVTRNSLRNVFLDFSQSYSVLFTSLERQPSIIVSLPPVISKLSAVEFFNGVTVLDKITISTEDNEFEEERQQATEEIRRETADRLEVLLTELNAELITPLQGARQSLNSTNPDHVRHFAISLRELFTHVLHTLAPDDKVKRWSIAPEYYHKGRPTRRARLLYICRVLNHEPFSTFIEKDVDAAVEFLQLFQQGAHDVSTKYTDLQLRIMLLRMESILRYILEIGLAS
jgi:hypothetical protein